MKGLRVGGLALATTLIMLWLCFEAFNREGLVWKTGKPAERVTYVIAVDPVDPSVVYTDTHPGHIYRSQDSGGTWSSINAGLQRNDEVTQIVVDPTTNATVYAATRVGIYKSADSGAEWKESGLRGWNVLALVTDPINPTTLYAGTSNHNGMTVFKSEDGGEHWVPSSNGLGRAFIHVLAIDPKSPTTVYAGDWVAGLFKSTNAGGDWSAVGATGMRIRALVIDASNPSVLYAATRDAGVMRSADSGATWGQLSAGLPDEPADVLVMDPRATSTLYAGFHQWGVFKSTDSGGSWSAVNRGLPRPTYVMTLAIAPKKPSTLFVGTLHRGIFRSTNSGGSWKERNPE